MEVRLSQKPPLPFSIFPKIVPSSVIPSQSFNFESWDGCCKLVKNHFRALTEWTRRTNLSNSDGSEAIRNSIKFFDRQLIPKHLTVLPTYHLSLGNRTGYVLLLVPLVAFCIKFIVAAIHARVTGDLRQQDVHKSKRQHSGSKSRRWEAAVLDLAEPAVLDQQTSRDSTALQDDQAQTSLQEAYPDYSKLEDEYNKFLSDCGISHGGYWGGGSAE